MNFQRPQRRFFREITLSSGLKVLLAHDPHVVKESAAMDIRAGSFQDPPEFQGLAHFLEHMLFIGTQNYPEVDGFQHHVSFYQGYSNAFTSGEHTNYFFEVAREGWIEALKRFASFFVNPLMDEKYLERELSAVHAEHEKNRENESWRLYRIIHHLGKPSSFWKGFSTGNRETLAHAQRKDLWEFFKTYYRPDNMKLALLSSHSLDEQEQQVRDVFQTLPQPQSPYGLHPLSSHVFEKPVWVTMKTLKEMKSLLFFFEVPSRDAYLAGKPGDLLVHLLGREGEGSLWSKLKEEGWIVELQSWLDDYAFGNFLAVQMQLTDLGEREIASVVREFFAYVSFLQSQGFPQETFQELKVMAKRSYECRELTEGGETVSRWASKMYRDPGELVDERETLFYEKDEEGYETFVNCIRPDRGLIIHRTPQAQGHETEPYYGISYSLKPLSSEGLEKSLTPYGFPCPNPYLPLGYDLGEKAEPNFWQEREGVYAKIDDCFFLPKIYAKFLCHGASPLTPREKALAELWVLCHEESTRTWVDLLNRAGIHYDAGWDSRGLELGFSSYSASLSVLKEIPERLREMHVMPRRFEDLKKELARQLGNSQRDAAYQMGLYELKALSWKNFVHRESILSEQELLPSLSLSDVQNFGADLFKKAFWGGALMGALSREKVQAILSSWKNEKLSFSSYDLSGSLMAYPQGKHLWQKQVFNNNNAYIECWQMGLTSPLLEAAVKIACAALSSHFFEELRTRQQLGYLVHMAHYPQNPYTSILFCIQSSDFNPHEIAQRLWAWQKESWQSLKNLDAKKFSSLREQVALDYRKKESTLHEAFHLFYHEAVVEKGKFQKKLLTAQACETMKHEEFLQLLENHWTQPRALCIGIWQDRQRVEFSKLQKEGLCSLDPASWRNTGALIG